MKAILILSLLTILTGFNSNTGKGSAEKLQGAWQWKDGNEIHSVIFSAQFYALAQYNLSDKTFKATSGGSWKQEGKQIVFLEEFNTADKSGVGKEMTKSFSLSGESLSINLSDNKKQQWTRFDDGNPGKLAGAWLITGRMNDDNIQKITPGARRTMKILSGKRFQWIAYNTDTKEFFGTGGGTYTTEQGKYTENIEFFSRDNSRVGQSLQFDFSLEDGSWRHKGLSSKGDPIDEVWTKREILGI